MNGILITFSPTGGTQKVARLLAHACDSITQQIDLCTIQDNITIPKQSVCIIAVPVFAGRVPAFAAEQLQKINGNGAKAVLATVYGNRAVEDALLELQNLSTAQGFICVAGVSAVAEHSIFHQYGTGRPDATDQQQLLSFATQIRQVLEQPNPPHLNLPGNHPYKPYAPIPIYPKTTKSCNNCGICINRCPAHAISSPKNTNSARCISCMRCVTECPQHARMINPLVLSTTALKLKSSCESRKENICYLPSV